MKKKKKVQSRRDFIVKWNLTFPLDRLFRKKYNFPFNSIEHRASNQIDILFESDEDRLFEEAIESNRRRGKSIKEYRETGNLLAEREESVERISQLFDDIDLSEINKEIGNENNSE